MEMPKDITVVSLCSDKWKVFWSGSQESGNVRTAPFFQLRTDSSLNSECILREQEGCLDGHPCTDITNLQQAPSGNTKEV